MVGLHQKGPKLMPAGMQEVKAVDKVRQVNILSIRDHCSVSTDAPVLWTEMPVTNKNEHIRETSILYGRDPRKPTCQAWTVGTF